MRLLLVEDSTRLQELLSESLSRAGYGLDAVASVAGIFSSIASVHYDLVIIDLGLPDGDGLDAIRCLRRTGVAVPILVITARGSIEDRVGGLDGGADDYLTKPFAFSELLARIQALLRRATHVAEATRLTLGDLSMDLLTREVTRSGIAIKLQPLEFSLLEYLMRNAGKVVSKTMIVEHVWRFNFDPQTNVVEARISKLRDKVDRNFERKLIHSLHGVGYSLRETS